MLRIGVAPTRESCDRLRRRTFLQVGVAGLGAIGLPDILRARDAAATGDTPRKNTSVILLWMDGGPSHIDMYDMKPEAPLEYRGYWQPIATRVSGLQFNELLPRQAQIADKFSIIRSLHHHGAAHDNGCHEMLMGRSDPAGDGFARYPSVGGIVSRLCGARSAGMPAFASVPSARTAGRSPGYFSAAYLGKAFDPYMTGGDPNEPDFRVQNLDLGEGLTIDRLSERRALQTRFDQVRRTVDSAGAAQAIDQFDRQAYELVTSPAARRAFDLSTEDPRIRDQYGRHTWGQSALLARRLVEAGCTFVSCHFGGWDHHAGIRTSLEDFLPRLDSALSALFMDLDRRGLLDRVLVIACGDFGRTPRLNAGDARGPGRDHWPDAICCLLGGGGIQGGRIVGATTARGEVPKDRPLIPGDLLATIYHVLGVDPSINFINHSGRPVPVLDQGQVIPELL